MAEQYVLSIRKVPGSTADCVCSRVLYGGLRLTGPDVGSRLIESFCGHLCTWLQHVRVISHTVIMPWKSSKIKFWSSFVHQWWVIWDYLEVEWRNIFYHIMYILNKNKCKVSLRPRRYQTKGTPPPFLATLHTVSWVSLAPRGTCWGILMQWAIWMCAFVTIWPHTCVTRKVFKFYT